MEVGLVRISVEEKEEHRYQLQKHLKALSEAGAKRLFYDVCSRNEELENRPGLQSLLNLIKENKVSRVYIPDIERLTVNVALLQKVIQTCRKYKIQLISINMGIDHTTESGELLAMITAAGGKFEWSRIQHRTKRNADFEKQHNLLKRGCFGYRLNKGKAEFDKTPFLCVITPETYSVEKIEELEGIDKTLAEFKTYLNGKRELSKYDIALIQVILLFEHKTVNSTIASTHNHFGIIAQVNHLEKKEILSNEISPDQIESLLGKRKSWQSGIFQWSYAGFRNWAKSSLLYQAIWHSEIDKPSSEWKRSGIITEEMHNQIKFFVSQKSPTKRSGAYSKENIFYKKVFCGKCGKPCSVVGGGTKRPNGKNKKLYLSYQCSQWIKERSRLRLDPNVQIACDNKSTVQINLIEDKLVEYLVKKAEEILLEINCPKDLTLEWTPEMLQKQEDIKILEATNVSHIQATVQLLKEELELEIARLITQQRIKTKSDDLILKSFRDCEYWKNFKLESKRLLISEIVQKIEILDGVVSLIRIH